MPEATEDELEAQETYVYIAKDSVFADQSAADRFDLGFNILVVNEYDPFYDEKEMSVNWAFMPDGSGKYKAEETSSTAGEFWGTMNYEYTDKYGEPYVMHGSDAPYDDYPMDNYWPGTDLTVDTVYWIADFAAECYVKQLYLPLWHENMSLDFFLSSGGAFTSDKESIHVEQKGNKYQAYVAFEIYDIGDSYPSKPDGYFTFTYDFASGYVTITDHDWYSYT